MKRLSDGDAPALTVRYARSYLRDYPDDGPAWIYLGIDLTALARYEEAEQAFSKAAEHCSREQQHLVVSYIGHLFREAGDFEQAALWYRKKIELTPEDATGHIFLGAALAQAGRLVEAEEAHRCAIACAEGCIDEAYLNLGLVLRARERFGEAADCFREALRLDPEYDAARRALADVQRCKRYLERAR